MKKLSRFIFLLFLLAFLIYLVLPIAEVPPLPDSLKSDEPGDTVEMVGVSAFYTDKERGEVVSFYRQYFSRSSILNLPLPVIVLNHPPEYTREAIRDTTESTFLYELVHPLRDSLFINGWDPSEHPKYKNAKDTDKVINKNNHFWERKITLRLMDSFVLTRLLVFSLALVILAVALNEVKKWR